MTEDELVGWHDRLNEHEFEQAPGVGDGQGKYQSQLPFPSPDLPDPGIKPMTPTLAGRFFTTELPGSP